MEESRRDAYRRIEEAAARRVASWPAWKQNATQVPIDRRGGEHESHGQQGDGRAERRPVR